MQISPNVTGLRQYENTIRGMERRKAQSMPPSSVRVFGCDAYTMKHETKARKCVFVGYGFVGYGEETKGSMMSQKGRHSTVETCIVIP